MFPQDIHAHPELTWEVELSAPFPRPMPAPFRCPGLTSPPGNTVT